MTSPTSQTALAPGINIDLGTASAPATRRAPGQETGLQQLVESNWCGLRATMNLEPAIAASEVTYVHAPTPSHSLDGISYVDADREEQHHDRAGRIGSSGGSAQTL